MTPSRRSKPRREHWCIVDDGCCSTITSPSVLAVCCTSGFGYESFAGNDVELGEDASFADRAVRRLDQHCGHPHLIVGHDGDPFAGGES